MSTCAGIAAVGPGAVRVKYLFDHALSLAKGETVGAIKKRNRRIPRYVWRACWRIWFGLSAKPSKS